MMIERLEQVWYLDYPLQYPAKIPIDGEHMAFGDLQQTLCHARDEDDAVQMCENFQQID